VIASVSKYVLLTCLVIGTYTYAYYFWRQSRAHEGCFGAIIGQGGSSIRRFEFYLFLPLIRLDLHWKYGVAVEPFLID
jgi:hypothetical protein